MNYEDMMKAPMLHPVAVEPRDGYHIWLRFVDGVEGTVDVSSVVGSIYFGALSDRAVFENVHINQDGCVSWGRPDGCDLPDDFELDICTESDYVTLLGLNPSEVWSMDRESRRTTLREAQKRYDLEGSAV